MVSLSLLFIKIMELERKICDFYCEQLKDKKSQMENYVPYEKDESILENPLRDIKNRLAVKLKLNDGICSQVLLDQLTRHHANLGEKTSDGIVYYNAREIIDLIGYVEEGKVKPKKGDVFKYEPLKGLIKVHHGAYSGVGYSLLRNIKEYWYGRNDDGVILEKKRKKFITIIDNLGKENIVAIANQMHMKAVMSKDLKGEWLIYHKDDNRNYYLCLASHNEGDPNIFNKKIEKCYLEFPNLKK